MVGDPVATDDVARDVAGRAARIAAAAAGRDVATSQAALAAMPAMTLEERGDFVIDTLTAGPVRAAHARTAPGGAMAQVDETSAQPRPTVTSQPGTGLPPSWRGEAAAMVGARKPAASRRAWTPAWVCA